MQKLARNILKVLILALIATNAGIFITPTKASSDFSYTLVASGNIIDVDNAVVNLENVSAITIKYEGYLSVNSPTLLSGWTNTVKPNEVIIKTNLNGTKEDIANYINNLRFTLNSSVDKATVKITLTKLAFDINNYVLVNDATVDSWYAAYLKAESLNKDGKKGYLANITSEEEQLFIRKYFTQTMWIGGTRALNTNGSQAGNTIGESIGDLTLDLSGCPTVCPTNWYWVSGPEKGTTFAKGATYTDLTTITYHNFASEEPNNDANSEGYLAMNFTADGGWNDFPNVKPIGFLVEYTPNIIKDLTVDYALENTIVYKTNDTPVQPPSLPSAPPVKRTCADDGKIWNEASQSCILEEVNDPAVEAAKKKAAEEKKKEEAKKEEAKKEEAKKEETIVDNTESIKLTLVNNQTNINTNNKTPIKGQGTSSDPNVTQEEVQEVETKTFSIDKIIFYLFIILLAVQLSYHKYKIYKIKKEMKDYV